MTKQNIFLSGKEHNLVSLDNVDLHENVMLLDAGCGYGKTTLILNTSGNDTDNIKFLDMLNEKRMEQGLKPTTYNRILIATSRKSTLEQMVSDIDKQLFNGKGKAAELTNPFRDTSDTKPFESNSVNEEDIPQLTTFAALANRIMKGWFDSSEFDMVVLDEAHSLILDSTFADNNYFLLRWLEQDRTTTKLFMTATPFIWEKFVAENENLAGKFNFKTINQPLPHKYQSDIVNFHYGTTMDKVIENYLMDNVFDIDNKCVAFSSSARGTTKFMLNDTTGRTMALVSKYNDKEINLTPQQQENIMGWELDKSDQHNRTKLFEKLEQGKPITTVDIMNLRESWVEELKKNGMLPNKAILIMATSAYREGISIKDKRLSYMGSEFPDEASLRQAIARGRHNGLNEIFIILNGNFRNKIEKQKEDIDTFLNKYKTLSNEELRQQYSMIHYELQKTPLKNNIERAKIVVEVKHEQPNGTIETTYEINHYLYTYYTYMEYHFAVNDKTGNTKEVDSEGFVVAENSSYYRSVWTGEKLPTWKEYYNNLLAPYSREGKVNFISGKELRKELLTKQVENNNINKAATLEELVKPYLSIKLTSDMKKDIAAAANEIGIMRSKKRAVSWTTIKNELENDLLRTFQLIMPIHPSHQIRLNLAAGPSPLMTLIASMLTHDRVLI